MPAQPPPKLEDPFHREATLGYNPPSDVNRLVRCVSHGTPSPLIRWHYHADYELHLVVATSGKFFVGDYIGHFAPGNLVLTGPNLPHNWISTDAPPEGVPLRDHCIVFQRAPLAQAAGLIPELAELLPLLDRAAQGIEFFGLEDRAVGYFERVAAHQNLHRLGAFLELLGELVRCGDYRLLSSPATLRHPTDDDDNAMALIDTIVNYLSEHCAQPLAMADVARRFHLSESHFSRVFRRGTGNTFTDFLIRVRISRACQLLAQTDDKIATVGFDAGFHNLANFNRRFLEVKGCTPSEFRLQGRAA
jgi:AraC-like DNA-binding protein|nr:AraC family transcriptional regulator [uncultured Albidiferax sp.]